MSRWCLLRSAVVLLTGVLPGGQIGAEMVGRFDTLMQVDNRYFDDAMVLEQRGEITLHSRSQRVRSGLSFALRQKDGAGETRLYRLFAEKRLSATGTTLTLGRSQRSDSLGFYTLDGAVLRFPGQRLDVKLYGGVPSRIDDYRSIDGDALYGIELHFRPQDTRGAPLNGRIGWQRYRNGASSDRLSWGVGAPGWKGVEYLFSGVYVLQEGRVEEASAQARGDLGENGRWQLSWQIDQPRRPWLTFRERFYSLYAPGRQSVLRGDFHYRLRKGLEWFATGRRVAREQGDAGYGLSSGIDLSKSSGLRMEVQLAVLQLSEDVTGGIWFQAGKAITSRNRLSFRSTLQYQDKDLYGVDRTAGVELDVERMLGADLYLSLFAGYLWNSRLLDEYRAGARLSWYLDQYKPEKAE